MRENMEEKIKYLEMIQNIIQRMANNSFLMKGWTVTLIVAVFTLSDKSMNPNYFWIAYVPVILFWFLDSYYLLLERKYIFLYDEVRKKDKKIDFDLSIADVTYRKVGNSKYKITRCILSLSEEGFYFPLGLIMLVIYMLG